jgi:hypothetical protein
VVSKRRRSKFEERFEADLQSRGVSYDYEPDTFRYVIPTSYTPDFKIGSMYIETKGYHPGIREYLSGFVHFKRQNPEIDVRFVFDIGITNKKLGKVQTFGSWAEKHGIKYAEGTIPQEWLDEQK